MFKYGIFRRMIPFLLVIALLATTSCGIGGKNNGKIFDYADSDATFELLFTSEYGDVRAAVTKSGGAVTMKVIEPERSAGITVKWTETDGRCVVESGSGVVVPLSTDAAAGLTLVFELLCRGEIGADDPTVSKSPDGIQTILEYDDGAVIIGEDGLPVAVECLPIGKASARTVKVNGYTLSFSEK